jgi:hypothetical protein
MGICFAVGLYSGSLLSIANCQIIVRKIICKCESFQQSWMFASGDAESYLGSLRPLV